MKILILVITLSTLSSCINEQEKTYANDIKLFKNSPVWELAQAVEREDTNRIKEICKKNISLLDYQEKQLGKSLLEWAVYNNRYESVKVLVKLGADPNLQSNSGTSAFIYAADKNETSEYVKLLLQYGGDPNTIAKPKLGAVENVQQLKTPLIVAAGNNIESVKLLVEAGADINYMDEQYQNALHRAATFDEIEIIRYLLIEKKADFSKPMMRTVDGDSLYFHNLLRSIHFPLDSREYKIKMEVVEYLKDRGMNYWETPIPKHLYDVYTKEYLEKY